MCIHICVLVCAYVSVCMCVYVCICVHVCAFWESVCLQKAGTIQVRMVEFSVYVHISAHWLYV